MELFESIFEPDRHKVGLRGLAELRAGRVAFDRLETALVERARYEGESWTDIGAALGVRRQTVRARYGSTRRRVRR